MGIMDVINPEDRVEIRITQLIQLIDDRAKAEAENKFMKRILPDEVVKNYFTEESDGEE